jgi:queuine tRNA-ribosyltransferase
LGYRSQKVKQYAHNHARVLSVATAHGEFMTPAFMPVGTYAVVNSMTPQDLHATGSQIILGGNTYHMLSQPGMKVVEALGGMHQMMQWFGPMLTDSGGYQVFSLSQNKKLCKIDEEGAHFSHPHTGQRLHLTPKTSIEAQKVIGADIIMAFDQCTPDVEDEGLVRQIMERTHRWLRLSKEIHDQHPLSTYGHHQALFGIIQGSCFKHLREESAHFVASLDLDGIAIGGESIGYNMPQTIETIDWIRDSLPDDKVRYTMGVGLSPQDLLDVIAAGIDIFDCVAPTRNARHGSLYHGHVVKEGQWLRFASEFKNHRLSIGKSIYACDTSPILEGCTCSTCLQYSRGYLHHLFKQKAIAYNALACIHNVHVMHETCRAARELVMEYLT